MLVRGSSSSPLTDRTRAKPQPTVRELAQAEKMHNLKKARQEHRKMLVETTQEDIADFEHKLGIRNRQPGLRYEDRKKHQQNEAIQMGVKLVSPSARGLSALDFYDYEPPPARVVPVQNPSKQISASTLQRIHRRNIQSLPTGEFTSSAGSFDHGFDPAPGQAPLITPRPDTAATIDSIGLDDEQLLHEVRRLGSAKFQYRSIHETQAEIARVARTKIRPPSVWTTETMLEPIFLPDTAVVRTAGPTQEMRERSPFVSTTGQGTTTLGWDSAAMSLDISERPPPTRGSVASRGRMSWEETVGRKYYEKRLEEFLKRKKKLDGERTSDHMGGTQNQRMREQSLAKRRAVREAAHLAACERGELFAVTSQRRLLKQTRSPTPPSHIATHGVETDEMRDEIAAFEDRLEKLRPKRKVADKLKAYAQ